MNFKPRFTSQSESTIVGIDNRIFFISEKVASFCADVGSCVRIGNSIVETDFILSSLAQVTSMGS